MIRSVNASIAVGLALILCGSPAVLRASALAPQGCTAWGALDGHLYHLTREGAVLSDVSLTNPLERSAISDDGSRIAGVARDSSNSLVIFDGALHQYSVDLSLPDDTEEDREYGHGAVIRLDWAGNSVLKIEKHISPTTSRFEFYRVDASSITRIARGLGEDCAIGSQTNRLACTDGDTIFVDDAPVLQQTGFENAQSVTSMEMRAGAVPVPIDALPGASLQLDAVGDGYASIRVIFEGNGDSVKRVTTGKFMPLLGGDEKLGLFLESTSADGVASIGLKKSTVSGPPFKSIAWRANERALLVVGSADIGSTIGVLQQSPSGAWGDLVSVPLAGSESAERFAFPNQNTLRMKSPTAFANGIIAIDSTGHISIAVATLPATAQMQDHQLDLSGWACN